MSLERAPSYLPPSPPAFHIKEELLSPPCSQRQPWKQAQGQSGEGCLLLVSEFLPPYKFLLAQGLLLSFVSLLVYSFILHLFTEHLLNQAYCAEHSETEC